MFSANLYSEKSKEEHVCLRTLLISFLKCYDREGDETRVYITQEEQQQNKST